MAKGKKTRRRKKTKGEISNPPPQEPQIGQGRKIVVIDTDLLDCSICTYSFCPPLHQCTNGHVACPSCWSKVQHKCPMCTLPVLFRNIALEKVLESVHVPCIYNNCPKYVSYSQMQVHRDTCEFNPFLCPIPGCGHKASSGEKREHFLKEHGDLIQEFLEQVLQLTQLQQQMAQLHTSNDGPSQEFRDYGKELQEMTEQERQLQNMSIAMHRFLIEPSNPPPEEEEIGGGREIVTIDTDLLDCSICTYPLSPPLHQCTNGHVACPSCWTKGQDKCQTCTRPVFSRNIALEKILEAVYVPCTYAYYGCREPVSYSQRQVHTDTCEFGLSLCPIPGCAHKAFPGEWWEHFKKDHRDPGIYYSYGNSNNIRFDEEDLYITLFGPDKDLFLLVKEPIPNIGNALCLY
ncbi:uncharacterized protein LOC144545774 [Carex rostrata]